VQAGGLCENGFEVGGRCAGGIGGGPGQVGVDELQEAGGGLRRPCRGCGVEKNDAGLLLGGVVDEVSELGRVGRGGVVDDKQAAWCGLPCGVRESLM
jgi:hypothetical protein